MKVLITGSTGLLGYNLQQNCPPDLTITSIYHPNEEPLQHKLPFPAHPLDITNHTELTTLFKNFEPDAVIHTAAQGSLDWCEENKQQAFDINVVSAKNIISLCEQHDAHFIFISSNAIYDGQQALNSEDTVPNPVNYYGTMKVDVEDYLKNQKASYAILRPNLMYGWPYPGGRDNQVTRVISALRSKEPINVVSDTYFSPLSVFFMSEVIWHVALSKIKGIYNIGGADRMNLFELSQLTAKVFSLNPMLLNPISHQDIATPAKRAIDTSFDSSLMQRKLNFPPLTVLEGLNDIKVRAPEPISAQ